MSGMTAHVRPATIAASKTSEPSGKDQVLWSTQSERQPERHLRRVNAQECGDEQFAFRDRTQRRARQREPAFQAGKFLGACLAFCQVND